MGRTLAGRFRIDKRIGRGGMATVYAAHVESGERAGTKIALKVVNRELTRDPTVLRRFQREAKSSARLKHPNTVEVFEYGVDGADAFIAMELAEGRDLLQALSAENPMRQARAAFIVSQVCAGLSAAHAQGIIHRDLKPENVMLIPSGEAGVEHVKVLDFGIAKMVEPPKTASSDEDGPPSYVTKTALTRVGTIVGTPAYMSPEQCRGGELDGRSDVYSCGILLYQILTGEVPFAGETPLHTAMRHIHAQPKPPSELRKDLSPALEKIILKALAKWPGERHQTADAMREELLAALPTLPDGQALLARAAKAMSASAAQESGSAAAKGAAGAPAPAKADAVMDATELGLPLDPRMGHGALGAGKLGSVRLSSAGAKLGSAPVARPPTGTGSTPTGKISPRAEAKGELAPDSGGEEPRTMEKKPAASETARPRPLAAAPSKPPPAGPGASGGAPRALTNTLRGVATSGARDSQAEETRAEDAPDIDDVPTGARGPREAGQPAVTTRPMAASAGAPQGPSGQHVVTARPPRGTQTGLTPTAQMARDQKIAAVEAEALEPATSAQDEDEPRTFIRTPPASVPTPHAYGSPEEPPPPSVGGAAGPPSRPMGAADAPYPDERPAQRTLVMDDPKALARTLSPPRAQPAQAAQAQVAAPRAASMQAAPAHAIGAMGAAPHVLAPQASPLQPAPAAAPHAGALHGGAHGPQVAAARTLESPIDPATRATQRVQPPQLGAEVPAPAPSGIEQPNLGAPVSFGVPPVAPPPATAIPNSTMRLPPEAARKAVAAAYQLTPYPLEKPAGVRGKLEELSRGAILLIGISLGLLVALIGLVIVILTK